MSLDEIKTNIVAMDTSLQTVADTIAILPSGLPDVPTAFNACNATAVAASATPRTIIAAGGAGKSYYITQIIATNPTTGEKAVLVLQDEDDVKYAVVIAANRDEAAASPAAGVYEFYPPLKTPANKALEVGCIGEIGDSYMTISGYVG